MNQEFTVYIEQDEDGMFIGSIPSLPSCHAEGVTQEEMMENLAAVLKLCLRNLRKDEVVQTKFVGIKNLSLTSA